MGVKKWARADSGAAGTRATMAGAKWNVSCSAMVTGASFTVFTTMQ